MVNMKPNVRLTLGQGKMSFVGKVELFQSGMEFPGIGSLLGTVLVIVLAPETQAPKPLVTGTQGAWSVGTASACQLQLGVGGSS